MLNFGSMERLVRAPEVETVAAATGAAVAPASNTPWRRRRAPGGTHTDGARQRWRGTDRSPAAVARGLAPRHGGRRQGFSQALDRFDSPAALAKNFRELTTKLSAGELRAVRPPPPTPRRSRSRRGAAARGLPDSAEAYVGGLALGDGMLAGEADRPLLLLFAETALTGNWSSEQYSQAVRWYFATQDQLLAERQRADGEFKHATARELAANGVTTTTSTATRWCNSATAILRRTSRSIFSMRVLPDGSLLAVTRLQPGNSRGGAHRGPRGALLPNAWGAGSRASTAASRRSRARCARPTARTRGRLSDRGIRARMQQEYRGLLAAREQARGERGLLRARVGIAGLVPVTSSLAGRAPLCR